MGNLFSGFADGQQAAESGGQQFGSDGKPLVGRYPDGTMPTQGKRAYGAGQIQIGTAKSVAQAHGIPFDENKLLNDKDYNMQLANLHMQDLRKHYGGDEALAVAAYHQGQSTVDNAVMKFGRQDFMQGIGPLGRAYTTKIMGSKGTGSMAGTNPTPLQSNQMPQLSQAPSVTPQEIADMQQPKKFDAQDPFSSAPVIGAASRMAQDKAVQAYDILGPALQTLQQVQQQRVELMHGVVDAKKSVNDQMGAETDAAIAKATPIFARQADLQARKDELRTMNPLKRLFKGLTDSRYNEVGMRQEQQTNSEDLDLLNTQYKTLQSYRDDRLNEMNRGYSDQNAMLQTQEASANLDISIGAQRLAGAQSVLGQLIAGNTAQTAIENAQNAARKNVLANLDEGQTNAAIQNAIANGGKTVINGIEFHQQDLVELSHNQETQRIGLEGMRLANLTGQVAFGDAMQDRTIASMTPDQKVAALAAGGQFQGQQFDRGKLAQSIEQDKNIATQQAQSIIAGNMTEQFGQNVQSFSGALNNSQAQVKQLIGMVPDNLSRFYGEATSKLAGLNDMLKQADARGAGAAMRTSLMGEITTLRSQLNEQLTAAANSWAGGNKTMGKVAASWLTGGPVSPQESAEAMVFMARNNTQTGIASDTASAVMNGIRGIVTKWDRQHAQPGQKKDEAGLINAVSQFAANQSQDRQLNQAIGMIPSLAMQTPGPDGNRHPFGHIRPSDFQAAVHAGDSDGQLMVANKLGFADVNQMNQFMTLSPDQMGTTGAALLKQARERSGNPQLQPRDIGQMVFNSQISSTIQHLNANFGSPEFNPGEMYADLLSNPQVMKKLLDVGNQAKSGGFTDFAVNSTSGSGYPQALSGYIKGVTMASQQVKAQTIRNQTLQAQQLASDPLKRTQFVLGLIPNLTLNEENALLDYVKKTVDINAPGPKPLAGGDPYESAIGEAYSQAPKVQDNIDSLITGGRIADPALEAIRKKAALHWMDYSAAAARGADRLTQGN